MATGLVVLGTTIRAFRHGIDQKVRYALLGATLILPSQVILGALTVTEYELLILLAHFVTAFTILTLLFAAATWSFETPFTLSEHRQRALGLVAALLPVYIVLSPRLVLVYSELVQVGFYAVGMIAYAALIATTLTSTGRIQGLSAGAAAILFAQLVVGRQVYGQTGELLVLAGAVLVLMGAISGYVLVRRNTSSPASHPETTPTSD
jgi:cytochrome c oxidase assembly protein subunit 15